MQIASNSDEKTLCEWHELKFKYSCTDLPNSATDFDVCCLLEKVSTSEMEEFV